MARTDLSQYKARPARRGLHDVLWFFVGLPLLRAAWIPSSAFRRQLLRLFGAEVGRGVVIKPGVRIKEPRMLRVGHHAWLGEDCWIDNLDAVWIGEHVCVSQGAYLCTGNHDWSDPAFALRTAPIRLGTGSWVGARSFIGPGVVLHSHAVATAGSVVTRDVPAWEIHSGNPAVFHRKRKMQGSTTLADEVCRTGPAVG